MHFMSLVLWRHVSQQSIVRPSKSCFTINSCLARKIFQVDSRTTCSSKFDVEFGVQFTNSVPNSGPPVGCMNSWIIPAVVSTFSREPRGLGCGRFKLSTTTSMRTSAMTSTWTLTSTWAFKNELESTYSMCQDQPWYRKGHMGLSQICLEKPVNFERNYQNVSGAAGASAGAAAGAAAVAAVAAAAVFTICLVAKNIAVHCSSSISSSSSSSSKYIFSNFFHNARLTKTASILLGSHIAPPFFVCLEYKKKVWDTH